MSAAPGDVVVIAGKGHEQGQEFEGGRKEPFDDATWPARRCARGRGRERDRPPAGRIAAATGGELVARRPERSGPERAVIDSREVEPGDLFVGLPGSGADGGRFAAAALEAGAWGALVAREHVEAARAAVEGTVGHAPCSGAALIAVDEPLAALHALARAWRRELGAPVIGVTGSTGKTSTKDILAALLGTRLVTHASRENLNTEIGLPLTILEARPGTEALVLEMAMRGEGQIAELVAVAEPDVGRDRERGARAPRAARHRRARGRGQGRADPRPAPGRAPAWCRRASRCSTPTCARRPRHLDLRPRRRRNAPGVRSGPRRDRGARRRSSSS